jgi:hypothetical protein
MLRMSRDLGLMCLRLKATLMGRRLAQQRKATIVNLSRLSFAVVVELGGYSHPSEHPEETEKGDSIETQFVDQLGFLGMYQRWEPAEYRV